jgi:putative transposase
MPRQPRIDLANYYYHVLNRSNGRRQIFNSYDDYKCFNDLLFETVELIDMRLLGYCIMPNHWHLILSPRINGDLSKFMNRLTNTHVKQYKSMHDQVGYGHLYQGRYKSFLIGDDNYFYTTLRYVERNALRAGLCEKAEDWRWGSAWLRSNGKSRIKNKYLTNPPIDIPDTYLNDLNKPLTESERDAVCHSVNKSKPFAELNWHEEFNKTTKQD